MKIRAVVVMDVPPDWNSDDIKTELLRHFAEAQGTIAVDTIHIEFLGFLGEL